LCAAQVAVDVSQQWTQPNGESLLPSRWNDLELAKNKGLDNDDSGAIMTVKSLLMYCLTLCISGVSVMF
jgi:hypothetical protein